MQLDEGNINILYAGSVRKTYAKTTQQFFKVLHGIPWKHIWLFEVQQSQGLLSGTYLYIYIYVAVWHCHCYCHLNIYIYIWNIFILSAEEKKKTSSTSDLPLSRRPASMLKPNFRGAPEVVSQSQQRFNCLQWNIFIKRIEMDIYHLIPSYLISWMDKYRW